MLRTLIISAIVAGAGTAGLACSPEDVETRQIPLVNAIQQLLAVDPAKAQAIVIKMQADLDQAVADGNDAATCRIMDEALASATGQN